MYDVDRRAAPTDGVSQTILAERLDAVVPAGTEAVTGATVAQETADAITEDLKIVNILFMIFAGVALFVGAFIIWNTFTMIVTQRSREIALLRAIGATRRQVLRQPAARGGPARRRAPPRSASRSVSGSPRA